MLVPDLVEQKRKDDGDDDHKENLRGRDIYRVPYHAGKIVHAKKIFEVVQPHPFRTEEALARDKILKRYDKPDHWQVIVDQHHKHARYKHEIQRKLSFEFIPIHM